MKGFLILMSFMTRLYVPQTEYNEEKLGKSIKFFPLIGFIIGMFLVTTTCIMKFLTGSTLVAILFMLLVEVILTGGIHLDGLADTFDGIFSYRSKQKMLEIMKDSRVGTNGVLVLIIYFLLKLVLLYEVSQNFIDTRLLYLILTFPIVARLASVVSCASAPYARTSGMGKAFVDNTKLKEFIIAFITTIILLFISMFILDKNLSLITLDFVVPVIVLFILFPLVIIIFSYLVSKLMIKKIGGITGDTLGAVLKISELIYILLFIIFINYLTSFYVM